MGKITIKQEAFARKYVECGNASEAYRTAYNVSEKTSQPVIAVKACEILKNGNVAVMVLSLQEEARNRTMVTVESLVKELEEAREMAAATEQASAMTGATMGKAKLYGLGVENIKSKTELSGETDLNINIEFVGKKD